MFQDTLKSFLKELDGQAQKKIVIINFDAVLHSSTLYCLFKIDEYFNVRRLE